MFRPARPRLRVRRALTASALVLSLTSCILALAFGTASAKRDRTTAALEAPVAKGTTPTVSQPSIATPGVGGAPAQAHAPPPARQTLSAPVDASRAGKGAGPGCCVTARRPA